MTSSQIVPSLSKKIALLSIWFVTGILIYVWTNSTSARNHDDWKNKLATCILEFKPFPKSILPSYIDKVHLESSFTMALGENIILNPFSK